LTTTEVFSYTKYTLILLNKWGFVMAKSTLEEIAARFDQDVERFSHMDTGQSTMLDSALVQELFESMAKEYTSQSPRALDLGCGAGNLSLRVNRALPGGTYHLVDLSANMLERAQERILGAGGKIGSVYQGDLESYTWPTDAMDFVMASAVLHHLRSRESWGQVLSQIHRALRPGGLFFFWDYLRENHPVLQKLQQERYRQYLTELRDAEYAQHVFDYAEKEDSPETLDFILTAIKAAGFSQVDVVHKNIFFGGVVAQK
jgi:tRNA (cmo5U34)-methyltransferase